MYSLTNVHADNFSLICYFFSSNKKSEQVDLPQPSVFD